MGTEEASVRERCVGVGTSTRGSVGGGEARGVFTLRRGTGSYGFLRKPRSSKAGSNRGVVYQKAGFITGRVQQRPGSSKAGFSKERGSSKAGVVKGKGK